MAENFHVHDVHSVHIIASRSQLIVAIAENLASQKGDNYCNSDPIKIRISHLLGNPSAILWSSQQKKWKEGPATHLTASQQPFQTSCLLPPVSIVSLFFFLVRP